MSETTEPDIEQILINVAQLLDGWHNDGTAWTEWDESVRRDVTRCREAWIQHLGALRDLAEAWEKLTLAPSLKLLAAEPAYVKARSVILGQNKEARASEKYAAVVALTGMSAQLTAALQENERLRRERDEAFGVAEEEQAKVAAEKERGGRLRSDGWLEDAVNEITVLGDCEHGWDYLGICPDGCVMAILRRHRDRVDTPTTQPPVLSEEG